MSMGLYINFKFETKEAVAFYEEVFNTKCTDMRLMGEMPSDGSFEMTEAMKQYVLNCSLEIHGTKVMFSDIGDDDFGIGFQLGNNISLVVESDNEELLTKQFELLAKDGNIAMPLAPTFWSPKYGMVVDKFNIGWQFSLTK